MSQRSIKFLTILLLCSVLFSGCTIIKKEGLNSIAFDPAEYEQGKSSWNELLADLGPPDQIGEMGSGMVWLYENIDISEFQVGASLQYEWLSLIKLVHATADAKRVALLLTFDEDRVLKSGNLFEWEDDLGHDNAVQFFLVVTSLADADHLSREPQQLRWGKNLLAPLPEGLNAAWLPELNGKGIELRGTPLKAGQHTLEMH
ncbi:hypothetical protein [Maridesulfovibrio ferrireducens]|uniref:hypothetical protein n=1 Tax=Maridesulfovibrio ferrireducens TaxID=246191 RepID=UPI001A27FECD|nr:hypothetical protein [Maridesulfovibrio ferrireducens]MBI9111139.1 hypothetical protein [Maridesulfovibrio ferrireducens]